MNKNKMVILKMTEKQVEMITNLLDSAFLCDTECNDDFVSLKDHKKNYRIAKKAFKQNGIDCLKYLK